MAVVSLSTIKNWFRTALKPTQQQFWDTWDSFWHKDELIPTSSVQGLDTIINNLPTPGDLTYLDFLTPVAVNVSGTATHNLPEGRLLEVIILEGTGTWKVGTSAGADDIVFEDEVSGAAVYRVDFYRLANQTIHITGNGVAKLYRR